MTTAAVLAFGAATTGALAQEPETPTSAVEPTQTSTPTSTPTSEPSTPPSTSEEPAPPSSSDPVPPSTTEQSTPPSTPASTPPSTPPATPEQPKKAAVELPDLKVTAKLDKAEYQSHEQVRVMLTITNQSAFAANRVRGDVWGLQIEDTQWGDFSWRAGGGRLAAGETRTIEVSGLISALGFDGRLDVRASAEAADGDANRSDNTAYLNANITRTFGNVTGFVYTDANRNGQPDAGEQVANGAVNISGGSPNVGLRTTTDANGRFSFSNVPTGKYSAWYELPGGLLVHAQAGKEYFTVAVNQTSELVAVAERPYGEMLTATAALDKDTYAYPAQAKVFLTLKNTSSYPLSGITAACGRSGEGGNLGEGPGWGDLRYDRGGVTLAAGESRSFEIVEDVPESARARGAVLLFCDFAPNAGWNSDGPRVADSATVTGGIGGYHAQVAHDKNNNHFVEPGEEISGVKVTFHDQRTGAVVAERTTDAKGNVEFLDVPVGTYWARVGGDWKFYDNTGAWPVTVTEWGTHTSFLVVPGKAAPTIRGTVKFEKARYESHETVRFSLTVTNIGGGTAEGVRLSRPTSNVTVPEEQWGDFRHGGPGITLAAGESRTFELSGTIRDFKDGQLSVWGLIDFTGKPAGDQSGYSGQVEVVQTKGDITGVVYTDKNRNGQQDAGEAAANVAVSISGGAPYGSFETTTDANGRFASTGIPSGDYYVGYTLDGGWIVHTPSGDTGPVRVQPDAPVQLTARAERPYSESLSATLTLDKDVYQVGEEAKVTITLTNRTDQAISGIHAGCNRVGNENQLGGRISDPNPTGWGDLLPPAKGVTVGAGETRTFVATEKVPQGAFVYGTVVAACDFAPNAGWNSDGPSAHDSARVPGGFGSLKGELFYDRNANWTVDAGEAIGNTRIVLHDAELGTDVAETFSDDKGDVRFPKVPAGDYYAKIDGPWKFEGENGGRVRILADIEGGMSFVVVPDVRAGTDNTPPAPAAAGGAGSGDALAKTGASVLGLGLVGALLVAFGFGASLIGRRRQTT